MVNLLENQTVVVIGGTSGIGFAVAKHVLEVTKANVVVASATKDRVENARKRLSELGGGHRVKAFVLNVSDPEKLPGAATELFNKIGTFHHLVYTAGDGFTFMNIENWTRADGEKIFNVRYFALLECVKHALPHMPSSRSSSVTLTSATGANRPAPGWALLGSGVSGALTSLCRGLALDLAPIRVNCVCPGVVDTELWEWLEEKHRKVLFEDLGKKFLTGRVGDPEEVAEAYGYLIRSNFVTGQNVTLDGGASLV
jgi:NAD(P)-dependent dehydrogenase (short-subunit alcohol dehydrogenase family)